MFWHNLVWNNFLQAKLQPWNSILLQWQQWWTFSYCRLPLVSNYSFLKSVKKLVKKKRFFCVPFSLYSWLLKEYCILWRVWGFSLFLNEVSFLAIKVLLCFPVSSVGNTPLYPWKPLSRYIWKTLPGLLDYLAVVSIYTLLMVSIYLWSWTDGLAICLQVTDVHLLTSVRLGHYTGCIILFHQSICEWTLQPWFLSVLSVGEVCSLQ